MSSKVLNIEVKIVYKTNLTKEEKRLKVLEILDKLKTGESINCINITIPSTGEIFMVTTNDDEFGHLFK